MRKQRKQRKQILNQKVKEVGIFTMETIRKIAKKTIQKIVMIQTVIVIVVRAKTKTKMKEKKRRRKRMKTKMNLIRELLVERAVIVYHVIPIATMNQKKRKWTQRKRKLYN